MRVQIIPFDFRYAGTVASWPIDDRDLLWLAPGTLPPLTATKVRSWQRDNKRLFQMQVSGESGPCAYGEINLMRSNPVHNWIGHIIVDPACRGCGIGGRLVALLLREAFVANAAQFVSLVVFPENHAAKRCYQRAGFVYAGDESHRFRKSEPHYRMQRMTVGRRRWLTWQGATVTRPVGSELVTSAHR